MQPIVLYGVPISLYTGRARSYLIKAGLSYREAPPTSAHFMETVLPKAGGRRSMPTVELPDGTVIRDSVAIVDHFESRNGHPFSPVTPRQRIVSRLFDAIGAEGLLRPAMHYRWNFDAVQREFIETHFEAIYPPGWSPSAGERMRLLREESLPALGVLPKSMGAIEELYAGLLRVLEAHFAAHPYLLGGRPCIGDFGMIGPLYGHLGRDPKPLSMMQTRALHAFRWVERMHRPEADIGEFEGHEDAYLADDAIPDTLVDILRQLAIDYVPETRAACEVINAWLAEQGDLAPGTTAERRVGEDAVFDLAGTQIAVAAQPFRFYVLKRVQDEFEALEDPERGAAAELLAACGMGELPDLRLTRDIGRRNNLEVWL